jgi:DNA-binding transcriptional LysR family regulator
MIDTEILDLKRLQMFYVAVKEGTFSAAAQTLGVSPSAISHALKGLEEDMDCSLFKRSGPHVSPTGAAIRLLPIVQDLLFRMSSIRSKLAKIDGREESLVFGVSASARSVLSQTALSAFCECFPNANVEVVHIHDGGDRSNEMELDFEIGCSESVPRDVVRRQLMSEVLQAYAAPFHGLGLSGKVATAQLRQSVLVFPDRMAADLVASELFQDSVRGLRRWIMPDAEAARGMALQGQCVAFLPEAFAETCVSAGDLNLLKVSSSPLRRSYSAWWNAGNPLTWIAEVFLSLLAVESDQV